jgi:hypothetical protein
MRKAPPPVIAKTRLFFTRGQFKPMIAVSLLMVVNEPMDSFSQLPIPTNFVWLEG